MWKWKLLSRIRLFVTPWTIQSMVFSRPEYWSGCPFPSPRDLPNPGIKPRSPMFQVDSLSAEPHKGSPRILECSLYLLRQIFPTQGSNPGLRIAGGFFTVWAAREATREKAHHIHTKPQILLLAALFLLLIELEILRIIFQSVPS